MKEQEILYWLNKSTIEELTDGHWTHEESYICEDGKITLAIKEL